MRFDCINTESVEICNFGDDVLILMTLGEHIKDVSHEVKQFKD